MELTNEFSLGVPVSEAWALLTDLERVAPCMPGFELEGVDGDAYHGVVRVKVGPMVAQYRGAASFRERDEAGRRAVLRAEGRETRGQGNAAATVTATLAPEGGGTRVTLHTDLTITGKVAQFGRGVLVDVSRKLLGQFVEALEADVLTGRAGPAPSPSVESEPVREGAPATAAPRAGGRGPRDPVDLWDAAGPAVIRRVGPLVLALGLALVLWLLLGR